jgi:predicted nucleotidyltransferase
VQTSEPDIELMLGEMVTRLVREYEPERIILFGSRGSGHAHPDSDIDLLVVKQTSERLVDRIARVRRILADPGRRIGLDIIVVTPEEVERRLRKGDQWLHGVLAGRLLYAA